MIRRRSCVAVLILAGCTVVISGCWAPEPPPKLFVFTPPDDNAALVSMVTAHIVETRGWSEDEFRVSFYLDNDQHYVYRANHRDDRLEPLPGGGYWVGGGKSVDVLVDRTTRRIVAVLRHQ